MGNGKDIAAGIAAVGLLAGGIYGYSQYQKLMDYSINFRGIRVHKVSESVVDFDIQLAYVNKSNVTFHLFSQDYKVFFNNLLVSTLKSEYKTTILKKNEADPSIITLNVRFDPRIFFKSLKKDWKAVLLAPDQFVIRTEINLRVGVDLLGIPITVKVPYTYPVTLKEVLNWYK